SGTSTSRPAADHLRNARAPGYHGMLASTSTVHSLASAANCWRLNGDDSGSSALGKILVITSTRTSGGPPTELDERQRAPAGARLAEKPALVAELVAQIGRRVVVE